MANEGTATQLAAGYTVSARSKVEEAERALELEGHRVDSIRDALRDAADALERARTGLAVLNDGVIPR